MITLPMIQSGYKKGIIRLVTSPHNDGIVCQIGEHWFYFGGRIASEYNEVEQYQSTVSEGVIVKEIYDVLEDFRNQEDFIDEYLYYMYFLLENGI